MQKLNFFCMHFEKHQAEAYVKEKEIEEILRKLMTTVILNKPDNPIEFMIEAMLTDKFEDIPKNISKSYPVG